MTGVKIQISAGELSGDSHGAKLVTAMQAAFQKQHSFSPIFFGVGGDHMAAAGVRLHRNFKSFGGVMGFGEVFKKLGRIFAVKNEMVRLLDVEKPSALILIDFPDFNLRIAKEAYKRNIPVFYFIPPKVWAWREGRLKLLKAFCKKLICILPFEKTFYAHRAPGLATFIGHPFCEEQVFKKNFVGERQTFFTSIGLDADAPTVVCLVGSRKKEVEFHFAPVLEALIKLREVHPKIQAIFCAASTIESIPVPPNYDGWIKITARDSREVMMMSDAGIIKSGTSTLEAAFARLPSVCIYKTAPITIWIARTFVKVADMALPNLIVPGVMKELLQEACDAELITQEINRLLVPQTNRACKTALGEVVQRCEYGSKGGDSEEMTYTKVSAYDRASQIICEALF